MKSAKKQQSCQNEHKIYSLHAQYYLKNYKKASSILSKNLQKKDMVILDVGAFTHYEKKHIPGAVKAFGPWQTMNEEFVGFMMPPVDELVDRQAVQSSARRYLAAR